MKNDARSVSLDVIREELAANSDLFETAAIAGSNSNDIDVFVVLREEHGPYAPIMAGLIEATQQIQSRLAHEHGVPLSVFPTFRVEIFDRLLSTTNLRSESTGELEQLHLLVYPTFEHFKGWEDAMLVKTVTMSADTVFGNEERFRALASEIEIPRFEQRVATEELFSLLIDTQIFLTGSKSPDEVVRRESAHKTSYVVRYLTFNYLLEDNPIDELLTWEGIRNKEIDEPTLADTFDRCYRWRRENCVPEAETIQTMNENLLGLLDKWLDRGRLKER